MYNLLRFFQKYNSWLLLIFLEIVALVLLFRYNSYQGSVYFTSANEVAGRVISLRAEASSYFMLSDRNRELTNANARLEWQIGRLKQLLEERGEDTPENLRGKEDSLRLISASVISFTTNRKNNILVIDKGARHGIREEMGVLSGLGVVGVVFKTTDNYSLVMPLLNSRTSVSCSLRGRSSLGNLVWDGQDGQSAILEDVPRHALFQKGDTVETSGYSLTFPRGIAIGKVVAVYDSSDGLNYDLRVRLFADFSSLRDVVVISRREDAELEELENEVEKISKQ